MGRTDQRTLRRTRLGLIQRSAEYASEVEGRGGRGRVGNSRVAIGGSRHIDEAFWSGGLVRDRDRKGGALRHEKFDVFVAHYKGRLAATLRLTTKKPWAIDRTYFSASKRPLYLLSMAVTPDLQRQGIGQQCVELIREICRRWPADAIRLDAYDAPAGAGMFYAKCGFRNVGRAEYRGCPLLYFEWLNCLNQPRATTFGKR